MVHLVELLIKAGADVNRRENKNQWSLHCAAANGHIKVVELLIKAGADVNIANRDVKAPLYLAATNFHTKVAKLLLEAGADINIVNHLLTKAAINGNIKRVKTLIEIGADVNRESQTYHDLYYAAANGHIEVVDVLLKAGTDVNMALDKAVTDYKERCSMVQATKRAIKYILLSNHKVTKPYCISNCNELSLFWDRSVSQLEKKLGKSRISVHKFLRETDENTLAGYLSNKDTGVREALEEEVENPSVYSDVIKGQFNKAKERRSLLDQSNMAMNAHNLMQRLPETARSKITSYLTDADLEKFGKFAGLLNKSYASS